jgi:serine/threonine protein kinase
MTSNSYIYGDITSLEDMQKGYSLQLISPEVFNSKDFKSDVKNEHDFLSAIPIPSIYTAPLNLNMIKNLLGNDFYQYNVMEGIQYVSEALLVGKNLIETSKKVHKNIGSLKSLAAGANGVVSSASVGDKSGLFKIVVKNEQNAGADTLHHEAFVGLAGTNKLRKLIPNYAYIYGIFECSGIPQNTKKGAEIKNYCNPDAANVAAYVLYENVPGPTLESNIRTMSADDFVNIYFQTLCALNVGNINIDFTHFDLHCGNIVLRKIEGGIHGIKYPTKDFGDIYLYTDTIATIIDLGSAHIKYKKKDYWYPFQSNINPKQSFPLFDAFKLLMFAARMAWNGGKKSNIEVYKVCEDIYKFFASDNFDNSVDIGVDYFYQLPNDSKARHYSLEPLMQYISKYFDINMTVDSTEGEFPLLECANICLTTKAVESEVIKPMGVKK